MNRIKELREKKGLTMREASRLLKMPYTTYVNYEKGAREPNSETLIYLADFYGTTIDYMLCKTNISGQESSDIVTFTLKPDEQALVKDYRELNNEGQEYIRQTMAMAKRSYVRKSDRVSDLEAAN